MTEHFVTYTQGILITNCIPTKDSKRLIPTNLIWRITYLGEEQDGLERGDDFVEPFVWYPDTAGNLGDIDDDVAVIDVDHASNENAGELAHRTEFPVTHFFLFFQISIIWLCIDNQFIPLQSTSRSTLSRAMAS